MATSTVGTGGDYSDWATWEAATDNDLVGTTTTEIGAQLNEELTITSGLVLAGATVNATYYRTMTVNTGAGFASHASKLTNELKYNASNGAALKTATSYLGPMIQLEHYARVTGLQIQYAGGGSGQALFATSGCVISGVIFEVTSGAHQIYFTDSAKAINSLFMYSAGSNAAVALVQHDYAASGAGFFNCTVVRPSDSSGLGDHAIRVTGGGGSNCVIKNTVVCGPVGDCINGSPTQSYNATDDATASGTGSLTSITYASQFEAVTVASRDFRTVSGGVLDAAGTRDQTNTNDLDIVGQARSTTTPTIGAWEVVAGGASAEGGGMLLGSRRNRLTIP